MNKNVKEILKEEDEQDEILKPMYHEGHSLKTRRDFLAQGFLGMTAFALAPTALSLLSQNAHAQAGCAAPVRKGLTPVIILDLAGGGNLAGSNIMVGGRGGQLDFLSDYKTLGLPPDFHPSLPGKITNELGLVFHSDSSLLRGIQITADPATRSRVDGAIFCSTSDDDTQNNQMNPMYWLVNAGATGTLRPLAGTENTPSGGRSQAPVNSVNPSVAPVKISSDREAINLVSLGNRFTEFNNNATSANIIDVSNRLSRKKMDKIDRRSLPSKIRDLVACGFEQTNKQLSELDENAISIAGDQQISTGFSKMTNNGLKNRCMPITKLVLDGHIGAGTIVLSGYDYHDGSRATGEVKDFELGQIIGSIMETARLKNKDVVIYVLTDGSVSAGSGVADNSANGRGKYVWTGDSGQRSATLMLVYKKDGKPFMRTSQRQIGYFKSNGSVEGSALLTSNSVVNTSKAMVANYLALHGKEGSLEQVIGDDPFGKNLDKYLVFDKLR